MSSCQGHKDHPPETHVGDDGGAVEIDTVLSASHQCPTDCKKPKSRILERCDNLLPHKVLFRGAGGVLGQAGLEKRALDWGEPLCVARN